MNMKKIAAVFGGVVFAFPALGLAQEPPTQPATTTPATSAGTATGQPRARLASRPTGCLR